MYTQLWYNTRILLFKDYKLVSRDKGKPSLCESCESFFFCITTKTLNSCIYLMLLSGAASRTSQPGIEPLTFWLCDCLPNPFPLDHCDKKLSALPCLDFKYDAIHFLCPISPSVSCVFDCMPVCLSLPVQYMGFNQLSESNNGHRQSGGEREGIINPLDVPFLFLWDHRRNPALNCWGDLKFQSACTEKQL